MKKYTYKIYTLGCKVNQCDSGKISARLSSAGFYRVDEQASLAVINTCCVTQKAILKCRQAITKAKKESPEAKIIICGCWPVVYKREINNKIIDRIIPGVNYGRIALEAEKLFGKKFKKFSKTNLLSKTDRSRYFLKIQDGCEQFCSYCIIPYTRGKLKSRGEAAVISEFKLALKSGYREIVLTGIHLGQYGRDKSKDIDLVKLLKKLLKIKNDFRIRLSSIEINEVSSDLIKLIRNNQGKICRHLHIPLQSGCDKILKLMNRPYNIRYYKNKIKKIRQAMPDFAISTDIIVGFPGESEKYFKEAYNFIKKIKFSRLHVFSFSAHEKTPAARFFNQVEKAVIIARAKKLRELGKKLELQYRKKFKNKKLAVLAENKIGDIYIGKTEYYFDIKFNKNDIIDYQSAEKDSLIKKLIKIKGYKYFFYM